MNKHHFFAASALDWATTTPDRDLQALLKLMDKQRNTYNLYLVPIPHDTPYGQGHDAPRHIHIQEEIRNETPMEYRSSL